MEQLEKQPVPMPTNVKHISHRQSDRLYALIQEADQRQLARLSTVTTTNPVLITLLFWFLPGFFIIHNFFIRYIWAGLLQQLLILVTAFYWLSWAKFKADYRIGEIVNTTELTERLPVMKAIAYGLVAFIVLWYLLDGITVYARTRKSNYRKLSKALR